MVRPHFRLRAQYPAAHADDAPAAVVAPDIGTIEASLRNCSIARRHDRGYGHHCHPHHHHRRDQQCPVLGGGGTDATGDPGDDITVELNSEVPLPGSWEQVLNMQTGEIHYINRADGTKTNRDPRHRTCYAASYTSADCSDFESLVYDADDNNTSSDDSSYYYNSSSSSNRHHDGPESSSSSSTLSTATATGSSTASSAESSSAVGDGNAGVLVLVGCRLCLTLSMVPRHGEECPKCGGSLLLRF